MRHVYALQTECITRAEGGTQAVSYFSNTWCCVVPTDYKVKYFFCDTIIIFFCIKLITQMGRSQKGALKELIDERDLLFCSMFVMNKEPFKRICVK